MGEFNRVEQSAWYLQQVMGNGNAEGCRGDTYMHIVLLNVYVH